MEEGGLSSKSGNLPTSSVSVLTAILQVETERRGIIIDGINPPTLSRPSRSVFFVCFSSLKKEYR